jgi:hypothetical protein
MGPKASVPKITVLNPRAKAMGTPIIKKTSILTMHNIAAKP